LSPNSVEADPVRFEQIFSNLLTNAAKYTDRGGVIRVRMTLENDGARISIQDNGIGISPESLPGLFDMFSQVKSALDRSDGGLGIGLSLVRGLVLLHGGTISAKSDGIGMGSEFLVTLPIAPATAALALVSGVSSVEPETDNGRLRVLVVDDNRDNADLCSILIKKLGHDVRTTYSGREALMIAAEFLPQFALLDIGMPDMNGYEVAHQIRSSGWTEKTMLVAVTGWGQESDKQRAYAAGFDHHITKPFDFNVLKRLLEQRRLINF
jgi:CheY-like chemotaxis protein